MCTQYVAMYYTYYTSHGQYIAVFEAIIAQLHEGDRTTMYEMLAINARSAAMQ